MQMINEQEVFETWSPVIKQKTSINDPQKVEWLSKYCHYHSLNESAGAYNTLGSVPGQGVPSAPQRGSSYNPGSLTGSGDKFPSLLPLAIQVAAKTVGFDIVPVIPMPGPTGVLTYLDYVYAGGKLNSTTTPVIIKLQAPKLSGSYTVGTTYFVSNSGANNSGSGLQLTFVGKSRIDGYEIWKVGNGYTYSGSWNLDPAVTVATASTGTPLIFLDSNGATGSALSSAITSGSAALVSALEDHVAGFTGAGATDGDNYQGPYANTDGSYVDPMNRETGESTYYRSMGLKTFTKFVEAMTYQVAAAVTTEQIQDLNKQFGIDVVSMVENALVNEVSQSINRHILGTAFALGQRNAINWVATEAGAARLDLDLSSIVSASVTGAFENFMSLQRRIFSKIIAAGSVVANRGRRGPANFVVTNSQLATAIQDISQFVAAPFANTVSQNTGALYPLGTLAGMTVYVDQNMAWNDTRILVGRKGGDDEPGLKFMPYMMAESITTISEGTMSPKIAVKSRYALVQAGFHPETMYVTFTVTTPTYGIV
jgi:hypothetical protein